MQDKLNTSKIYILYYNYNNTAGNHAGIAYLAKYLNNNIANVRLIKNIPQEYKLGKYIAWIYTIFITIYLVLILNRKDKVFFSEYLTKQLGYQVLIAKLLRFLKFKNEFYALVHLSGQHLLELYSSKENILRGIAPINKTFVFGSSLKNFLENIGVSNEIIKTFLYADTEFYFPETGESRYDKINILSVGNLKRDFSTLLKIVLQCPDMVFHICVKKDRDKHLFKDIKNVVLYPFLPEIELLQLMQKCNTSISVMEDTIGSIAITTSMAVGLVQIVSDVGSIRDYCNDENSFLCQSVEDFVKALNILNSNNKLLKEMSFQTIKDSRHFSKEAFLEEFKKLIDV